MTTVELQLEGRLLLGQRPIEHGVVQIAQGRVLWSGARDAAPRRRPQQRCAVAGLIAPGFVDLHVHGGGGADVVDGTAGSLRRMCRVHVRHGTVALCPTVLCAPTEVMLRSLAAIRRAHHEVADGARVLGAHLEGPFLSPRRVGAQPAAHVRAPDVVLLEELLAAAGPSLRLVTLAPELPGALELVARLVERGVVVALGHSDATFAQAIAAVAAGARMVTHTFNAMSPLHHREPGLVGAALLEARLVAEVIADGVHVVPPALRLLRRIKRRRLALATDCTAALEAPRGRARLGSAGVVVRDGAARLIDGTLAGSVLTMERAVANFVHLAGASIGEAVVAASRVPLRLLGERGGALTAGELADLVVLDEELRVQSVFMEGREVVG
jgi:N-acetylglucosamine-6-phosphate deacetylase